MLILILLILIFTQPYNKEDPFKLLKGSNTALFCWLDPTLSMSYQNKDMSLWQDGCNLIAKFDSILPSTAKLYYFNESHNNFIDFRKENFSLEREVRVTPIRHGFTNFESMIQKFNLFRRDETRKPILLLISDFQVKDKMMYERYLNSPQATIPIICLGMGVEDPWNYALANTRISYPNRQVLKSNVLAQGRDLITGEVMALIESMRVGQKSITVKKNDTLEISIDLGRRITEEGGMVKLNLDDPYLFDNIDFFTKNKNFQNQLLVIADGDESFPLITALKSLSVFHWTPPKVKDPFAISYEDLDSAEVIFLSSINQATEIVSLLWRESGLTNKVIVYSPNIDNPDKEIQNSIFSFLNAKNPIRDFHATPPLFPVLPDTISSLWQDFPRFQDRNVSFYNYLSPLPGKSLLAFNKGMSLVNHLIDKNGSSWIIWASPLGITKANNLCETGFYVPILHRLINYGLRSIFNFQEKWIAGKSYNNPYAGKSISAKVFSPENKLISFWDRQVRVQINAPGLFKIQPSSRSAYWLAVIADSSEGVFVYSNPHIQRAKSNLIKILPRSSVTSFINQQRTFGYDIIWIILSVCLLIEILLWKNSNLNVFKLFRKRGKQWI